jgi:putative transcriptional regulator
MLPDDVFTSDPDQLWRSVMRRQGGRLAAQGLYPDDLSVN